MGAIAPVLAGGVVGLVSLLVGRWLERRSSQQAWLHDERMKAYLSLLRTSYDGWQSFEATYSAMRRGEADAGWADLQAKVTVLSHAREEVALVGPQHVARSADDVARCLFTLAGKVRDADSLETARATFGSMRDWPDVERYQECHDAFLVSARGVIQHLE